MSRKQLVLSAALIVMLAMDAYSVYLYGFVGFFRVVLANFAGLTAFLDLLIALVLIIVWMGDDAASATSPRCHLFFSRSCSAASARCCI